MSMIIQNTDTVEGFLTTFWDKLATLLPNLLAALLLVLLGLALAKICSIAVKKLLQSLNFDVLGSKFIDQTSLNISQKRITPSAWTGTLTFWIVLLVFVISASETLGWTAVSASIIELTAYLPRLLSALIVFILGLYIASFIRGFIRNTFETLNLSGSDISSRSIFYLILLIVGTTALKQAGIETTVITANISIVIGGVLLAFAIGFGYSSRDLLTNILSSFYARNTYSEGQTIKIDNIQGQITKIDRIQTTIATDSGELIIPNRRLISESIERLNKQSRAPMASQTNADH